MRTNILFLVGSKVLVFCTRPRVKKLPTTSSYLAHLWRSSTFCSVSSSSRPKRVFLREGIKSLSFRREDEHKDNL
uniref:Uncharacterized protein n=1 Tax=Oryza brachyantha TaxID=4533 RepID=J3KVZ0_ORYBR